MRSTIEQALAERAVATDKPDVLETFVNRELRPVVSKARAVLNYQSIDYATGDSDGAGTALILWTSPEMTLNSTWHIEADITGIGIGNNERASYKAVRSYRSIAGVLTASPMGIVFQSETTPAIDAGVSFSGTTATCFANDGAAGAMRWTAVIKTTEVVYEP